MLYKACEIEKSDLELEAKATPREIKIGTILYQSWGYDQTNIDFFVVIKRTKCYAWVLPMSNDHTPTEYMQGKEMPGNIEWHKEPVRRKIRTWDGGVSVNGIEDYQKMSIWKGQALGSSSYH